MIVPDSLRSLFNRPVAVLGAGVSGFAVVALLKRLGVEGVLYDEYAADFTRRFTACEALKHRVVVYSPGFSPDHSWVKTAQEYCDLCIGELEFASLFWDGRIIAITGTNGKTTLTCFLNSALKRVGLKAVVVGNVGVPFSGVFETIESTRDAVAVCEVSSFQSEVMNRMNIDTLIWTNFEEDHLDRHKDLEDYFAAKWRLIEVMKPSRIFVGASVAAAATRFDRNLPPSAVVVDRMNSTPIPKNSVFESFPQRENYLLVHAFWRSEGYDENNLLESVHDFQLPNHRLQKINEREGVRFWNDSKATNFSATLAAVQSFDQPVYWIGGGQSKGGDLNRFVAQLQEGVCAAFLIGTTALQLENLLRKFQIPTQRFATLDAAVAAAFERAEQGTDVLFSPGFASFDMFSSYAERGVRFEEAVLKLKTNTHSYLK